MTDSRNNLQRYLTIHLTGAGGATSMLRGLADRLNAADLHAIVGELEDEQHVLRDVAEQMDLTPSHTTRLIAGIGEKVSRLVRRIAVRPEELRDLAELEAILTGIRGKMAMWRLLPHLVDEHPALAEVDCARLLNQAERQASTVEAHRVARGRGALGSGPLSSDATGLGSVVAASPLVVRR